MGTSVRPWPQGVGVGGGPGDQRLTLDGGDGDTPGRASHAVPYSPHGVPLYATGTA